MLIELQRIPYSTKGMGWDNFDNWLEWDKKNINPLREVLHKAEKELGEITNPYEPINFTILQDKEEIEKIEGSIKKMEKEGTAIAIINREKGRANFLKEQITKYSNINKLGFNRGFSTMGLKELKELRERVPNKYAFDIALKKLIEIEIEWEKRFNGIKELPKDYKWGENHLDIFKAEEWLKNIRGGEIKMIQTYTGCPITLMIYGQNKQPAEFEKLNNEKFIDENGVELWDWCKENGLQEFGETKHCFCYTHYKADEKYLILIGQSSVTSHLWDNKNSITKDGCVANYGGSWGSGGNIHQYQELERIEQNYKEENEGKSYSCLKGFAKIFMTERAWAVAKLIKERKVYIPEKDFYPECKTIKEKADECITQLDDYYLFMYPERGENNNHSPFLDLKFWIVKAYGEERFKQEYEKAKKKNLPIAFKEIEKDLAGQYGELKVYLEYKEKDSKYAQGWLKECFKSYNNLKRIANEMGRTIKSLKEYQEEVREGMKQRLAEKLKKEYDSEMAKEVLTEMIEGKTAVTEEVAEAEIDSEEEDYIDEALDDEFVEEIIM